MHIDRLLLKMAAAAAAATVADTAAAASTASSAVGSAAAAAAALLLRCCCCWLLAAAAVFVVAAAAAAERLHWNTRGCSRRVNRNAVVISDLFFLTTAQRASFFDTRCKKRVAVVLSYKRVTFVKKSIQSQDPGRRRPNPWHSVAHLSLRASTNGLR